MLYDPVQAMMGRRTDNRNSNQVRNKLQLHARELQRKAYRLKAEGDKAQHQSVSRLIGEIKGYIAIRQDLAPYVSQDGYSNELKRCIMQLQAMLETKNEPE